MTTWGKVVILALRIMTLLAAVRKHRGNVQLIADELGVSRQTVYNQLEADPEAKRERDRLVGEVGSIEVAIRNLTFHVPGVDERAAEMGVGRKAAARAVAVEVIAAATNRARRDVAREIANNPGMRAALNEKLPADDDDPPHLFPATITLDQWRWLRGQRKGTAARLLAEVKRPWPKADPAPPESVHHTSFHIPTSAHDKLLKEAARQGVPATALFRAVLESVRKGRRWKRAA